MRTNRPRLIRRLLVAGLLLVAGAVGWNLRRTTGRSEPGQAARAEESGTKVGEMFFVRFNEGGRPVEVKAKAMTTDANGSTMHLETVEASLPFLSQGKAAIATIHADRCKYQPQPLQASFRGHVSIKTDEGMELETESLDYDKEKDEAVTKDPARFRRGNVNGSSVGMRYKADGLELWADVKLTFRREGARPTEIEAGNASLSRQENRVYFNDGVLVRQGGREVRSGRLQLNMADEFRIIEHAAAIEDVFVRIGAGADVPGARIGAAPGEKQLRCRRLNVGFDEKGAIREATGINPATLDLLPGPGETESRRLTAHRIAFAIDERGVLTQVQAYAGERPDDVQTVVFTSTAGPAPASTRRVECRYIGLMIDPESGRLARAIFDKQVVFSEPGRKGWADRSVYDGGTGKLSLEGREPRIVEEKDGSELRAGRIEIGTQTRSVSAFDNVRHTINRRRPNAPAAARGTAVLDEPTVVVARRFEYDAAKRSARYSENALLRSGKDEIRAPLIVIEEPAEGHRKLTASGGVTSTLHAKRSATAKKDPAPIESRSKELVYDESAHRAVYTGDVEVRQGDIQTVSPEVVVVLGREEGSVERVLAGAPVDLRQGARRATGERATYTPADETVVLVGEKVVVQDADRRAEGRVLTFQVGSDRIRLDGRDEVRTEAVLKRREPPKP